jgi:nucleoid-associated protein YgaU
VRAFVGLGILLALFAGAWWFHRALQSRLDSGRAEARAAGPDERVDNGWSRLIVGRPAAREAFGAAPQSGATPAPISPAPPAATALPAVQVARGQTLRQIALVHYGAAAAITMADVAALARANGLADPDRLEVGQWIRFPELDALRRRP